MRNWYTQNQGKNTVQPYSVKTIPYNQKKIILLDRMTKEPVAIYENSPCTTTRRVAVDSIFRTLYSPLWTQLNIYILMYVLLAYACLPFL